MRFLWAQARPERGAGVSQVAGRKGKRSGRLCRRVETNSRWLRTGICQALEQCIDLLVNRGIEYSKGVLDKAFIKKIFFDVTLDHRIQVLLVPAQGTGGVVDMNCTDQMNCDGIFCLHESDSHV